MRKDKRDRKKYYAEYYQRNREAKLEYEKQRRETLGKKVLAEYQKNYYIKNHHMMAFKKMILKEKKRTDHKDALKVNVRNAMMYLEKALEE